jgi:hypothetical protein
MSPIWVRKVFNYVRSYSIDKYFYKNKKSKLCFGDRVIVLNVKFFLVRREYGNHKKHQINYKRLF